MKEVYCVSICNNMPLAIFEKIVMSEKPFLFFFKTKSYKNWYILSGDPREVYDYAEKYATENNITFQGHFMSDPYENLFK